MTSVEEAFLVFSKWLEENRLLHFGPGGTAEGPLTVSHVALAPAQITEISGNVLKISTNLKSGNPVLVTLDVSGAEFEYQDSRAGLVPELVERKWICFLLVTFASGRRVLFAEGQD